MLFLHVFAGGVKPERVFCTFSLRSCHSNLRAAGPVHSNLAYGEDERGGGVMGGWGELGWAGMGWGGLGWSSPSRLVLQHSSSKRDPVFR